METDHLRDPIREGKIASSDDPDHDDRRDYNAPHCSCKDRAGVPADQEDDDWDPRNHETDSQIGDRAGPAAPVTGQSFGIH